MDEKDYQALASHLAPVIRGAVEAATAPLLKRIEELEGREPLKGDPGDPGRDAPSAEEVKRMVEQAVAALPPAADGQPGRDGKDADPEAITEAVMERVTEALKAIPAPKDGQDGADGVGLAGAMIDRSGELVVTLTDGTPIKLGPVVGKDGDPGKNGADALGFDDLSIQFDDERSFKFVMARGEVRKEFGPFTAPWPIYRGVYAEGTEYKAGDAVTWGGSLHIAQQDTCEKPETPAWRLAVKRGRDGKDGIVKHMGPPQPVKVD